MGRDLRVHSPSSPNTNWEGTARIQRKGRSSAGSQGAKAKRKKGMLAAKRQKPPKGRRGLRSVSSIGRFEPIYGKLGNMVSWCHRSS